MDTTWIQRRLSGFIVDFSSASIHGREYHSSRVYLPGRTLGENTGHSSKHLMLMSTFFLRVFSFLRET